MSTIDPDAVEADVRRYLGEAYGSLDAHARYGAASAAAEAAAAHAQAVAARIADERALAAADLYDEETAGKGDKKAFAEGRLALTRQRFGQLLDRARVIQRARSN